MKVFKLLLWYCAVWNTPILCMEHLFTNKEVKYNAVYGQPELKSIVTYVNKNRDKLLPPVLITSHNETVNRLMGGILALSLENRFYYLRPLDSFDQTEELKLEPEEKIKSLVNIEKNSKDLCTYFTVNLNDLISKFVEIKKEKHPEKNESEIVSLFCDEYIKLEQPNSILIATEANLESIPKSLRKLFVDLVDSPYPTTILLNVPNKEKYPHFLGISYLFICKNKDHYIFCDSVTGNEMDNFDITLTLASLFLKFKLTEIEAKTFLQSVMPLEPVKSERIIWTKSLLQEIAKMGFCCAICFADPFINKYYKLEECCSKIVCEYCWNEKHSILNTKKCPLCDSKLKKKPILINPNTYTVMDRP